MWQVAGGHGYIDHELAIADMMRYHDAGFTTWDLADIYGPAEDFIGQFRRTIIKTKRKRRTRENSVINKMGTTARKNYTFFR